MSAAPWSHPALLRGEAAVIDADTAYDAAPWVGMGAHLRMRVNPRIGFPLCPFTVWHGGSTRVLDVIRPDANRPIALAPDVVAVFMNTGNYLAALDAGRVTSERTTGPFVVATPSLQAVRADGASLISYLWDNTLVEVVDGVAPIDSFGLPFNATSWWTGPNPAHKDAATASKQGSCRYHPTTIRR